MLIQILDQFTALSLTPRPRHIVLLAMPILKLNHRIDATVLRGPHECVFEVQIICVARDWEAGKTTVFI